MLSPFGITQIVEICGEPSGRAGVEDQPPALVIDGDDLEPAQGVGAEQALEFARAVATGQVEGVQSRGRQVDLGDDRGAERLVTGHELAAEGAELAAYLAHHHVPDGEAHLAVDRVDRPGAGDVSGDTGQGAGVGDGHEVLLFPSG